ncbi:hypothetical protein Tco_0242726 [Tanacetum coccineum]
MGIPSRRQSHAKGLALERGRTFWQTGGSLNPSNVGQTFKIERVGEVHNNLNFRRIQQYSNIRFHVSNLKKCHADEPLAVSLDGLILDDKLHFVEEPLEIVGREVKR